MPCPVRCLPRHRPLVPDRIPFALSQHKHLPDFDDARELSTPTASLRASRSPVTMDVMFELFDNELLITDNAFHHVANRNYTN
jgi:hypothetical protein